MKIGYLMQAGVPDVRHETHSGPANHVRAVCTELRNLGHDVRLVALLDGQIWRSDDLRHYEALPLPLNDRGPLRWCESAARRIQAGLQLPYAALFDSLRFAVACRRALRGYDLLYERMGWMGWGGGLAATWLGIPLVLEVNGDHQREMELLGMAPRGLQLQLSRAVMRRAARRAAHTVATGEGWRRRFVETWDVDPARVTVVENGSAMVDRLQRQQLRAFQPPLAGDHTTVVYLGGFEVWHGVDVLVRAVERAVRAHAPLRLRLIGSGTLGAGLAQLIQELNLAEYVSLSGPRGAEELAHDLAAADLGAAPYCGRAEFSGLKVLDYKAAGLAAIVSGRDHQPDVIRHGETGWIVPPGDLDALSDALTHLTTNVALRQAIGRQARIEAEARHRWRHTAERLELVFRKVLAR